MNAQDQALVDELAESWRNADIFTKQNLLEINIKALAELLKSRRSLRFQIESNRRAIEMREAMATIMASDSIKES